MTPAKRHAFSLVELSIVLVILGLLTGGILAGQSLIRGAEIRAITTEFSRYATATNSFRDKYFAIPGDMNNATKFWNPRGGTGSAGDTACYNVPATGTATCNGDGGGTIKYEPSVGKEEEMFLYWQHLANAGLIEGSYIGTIGTNGGYAAGYVSGVTQPASKFPQGIWHHDAGPQPTPTTSGFAYDAGSLALSIRGASTKRILKPEEAWNIDTKMDDGLPATGKIMGDKGNGTTTFCSTVAGSASDTGAQYNLSSSATDCMLTFLRIL